MDEDISISNSGENENHDSDKKNAVVVGGLAAVVGWASNYFSADRTQPFFITFVQAILAFKRVAKLMKKRYGAKKMKHRNSKWSQLKFAVQKSTKDIANVRRGAPAIYMTDLINAKRYFKMHEDETKVHHAKHARIEKRAEDPTIILSVARHLDQFHSKLSQNKVTVAQKLKRALKVRKVVEESRQVAQANGEVANIAAKNTALATGQKTNSNGEKAAAATEQKEMLEYLTGTVIYYGSTVALQAKHGGYLSFLNAADIKASAHKVLTQTKFIIINSGDLTDFGAVKYGDAIWLQAGQHEVLGANYAVNAKSADKSRTIRPALINCRRKNIFKAQQYGRWIVLNRDKPTESIGGLVLHHDRIMLEQEWYYLASSSPYDAGMHRQGGDFDAMRPDLMSTHISSNKQPANVFRPGEECVWKMHLVGLPGDEKGDEKARQQLLHHAQDQMAVSESTRFKKFEAIMRPLRDNLPFNLTEEGLFGKELKHLNSEVLGQKHLLERFSAISLNGFAMSESRLTHLQATYGKDSKIVECKRAVNHMRKDDHGQIKQAEAVIIPDHRSTMQREKERYWDAAENILIHSDAWAELKTAMDPYFGVDRSRKVRAAIAIQRAVRTFLAKNFSYPRLMAVVDEKMDALVEKQVRKERMLEGQGRKNSTRMRRESLRMLSTRHGSISMRHGSVSTRSFGSGSTFSQKEQLRLSINEVAAAYAKQQAEIIREYKAQQAHRISVLIRPVTAAAALEFSESPSIPFGEDKKNYPGSPFLLPVESNSTAQDMKRVAPRTQSFRVIAKPVSITSYGNTMLANLSSTHPTQRSNTEVDGDPNWTSHGVDRRSRMESFNSIHQVGVVHTVEETNEFEADDDDEGPTSSRHDESLSATGEIALFVATASHEAPVTPSTVQPLNLPQQQQQSDVSVRRSDSSQSSPPRNHAKYLTTKDRSFSAPDGFLNTDNVSRQSSGEAFLSPPSSSRSKKGVLSRPVSARFPTISSNFAPIEESKSESPTTNQEDDSSPHSKIPFTVDSTAAPATATMNKPMSDSTSKLPQRPHTASSSRQKLTQDYIEPSLRHLDLPLDVLRDTEKTVSTRRGMKFLRLSASDPNLFKDVVVRKRK